MPLDVNNQDQCHQSWLVSKIAKGPPMWRMPSPIVLVMNMMTIRSLQLKLLTVEYVLALAEACPDKF